MKLMRCTAESGLVIRTLPAGRDTGRRIRRLQTVRAHGQSFDGGWLFVESPAGEGWASAEYLAESEPEGFTVEAFARAADIPPDLAARWHPHVMEAASRFDFMAPSRLAMWIAQCGHESASFRRVEENLNYRASQLRAVWPRRFPTEEKALAFAHQPERIANHVYAGRLGNGPEASGDGWRFRGRGLVQVTGRSNYRACGAALGLDLEDAPELLATDLYAALSAGWFWDSRGLNGFADRGDVEGATKRINGGLTGLTDRRARYERAAEALGVAR